MRLRLIRRVPYLWATVFAGALAVVQILEHTSPLFALCSAAYILVSTTAFNYADGLTSVPGAFVFFASLLTCIVGLTTKAFLGQPAETNLKVGLETMEIELLAMVGTLVAVLVERRFRSRRPLLETYLAIPDLDGAFIGCAVVGVVLDTYSFLFGVGDAGSFLRALHQINYFTPFAIILGTIQVVRKTNGRQGLSWATAALLLFGSAQILITFSKQAFLGPCISWLLGLIFAGYRLKVRDMLLIVFVTFLFSVYLYPYAQWGRSNAEESLSRRIEIAGFLLQNMDIVRSGYRESQIDEAEQIVWDYYAPIHAGLLERLTMLPPDDSLIEVTDREGIFGLEPIKESIENLVPHVIWKDKPTPYFGNIYAQQIGGIVPAEDTTTGISFGVPGDAYHEEGLFGVLFVLPVTLSLLFLVLSYMMGSTPSNPASLLLLLVIAHSAPEWGLWGQINLITEAIGVCIVAFVCRTVFSVIGSTVRKAVNRQRREAKAGSGTPAPAAQW